MAIVYCCWTTGDDTTGDGSYGTPYKTITKASTGLTGGDEVRVSKSPAHTALTGTLTWTYNSVTVSTSADLTGELTANLSLIGKDADDGMWYEISAVTSTTITLRYRYCGTSATTAGYQMGYFDLGSPTLTQQMQVVSASGSSVSSLLSISGGWDLSTQTKDGISCFCTTHGTNRYGYLLYSTGKSYFEIENFVFARGYTNIYFLTGQDNKIKDTGAYSGGDITIRTTTVDLEFVNVKAAASANANLISTVAAIFDDVVVHNNSSSVTAVHTGASIGCHIKKLTLHCCQYGGITISSPNTRIDDLRSYFSVRGLVIFAASRGNGPLRIDHLIYQDHTRGVDYLGHGMEIIIGKLTESGNTRFVDPTTVLDKQTAPLIFVQRWNDVAGDSRVLYRYGTVYRDTADARSGACIKATPTDATYYMEISIGKHRVTSVAADIVLSVYAKDDATFNGDVALMAKMNQSVVNEWTAKTMDTTYGQHSLTVDTLDLVNGEWLELVARVRGTAGSVFFDDFAAA